MNRMMAQHVYHSRSPVVVLLILAVFHLTNAHVLTRVSTFPKPTINSVRLTNPETLPTSESILPKFGILVEVIGTDLHDDLELSWSVNERDCVSKNGLRKLWTWTAGDAKRSVYEFQDDRIFKVNVVYFCTKTVTPIMEIEDRWINIGKDFTVNPKTNG